MDFAATRKNTGANIVNAGNAAGNALTSFLETSRQAAPDYTQLSALNIAAQSSKAATAVEAEAKVRANKIELEARTKAYDKVSKAKSDAERWVKKAGMLAGMGQLAIEATKKKKDPPPPVEIIPTKIVVADNEDIDKVTAKATKKYDELLQNMPKPSTSGSTTGTVPASSHGGTPTETHQAYYDYLTIEKGLSRNKALGIMANISRESSFNPFSPSGDDKGAGGLFQYYDVRQTPEVKALVKAGDWKGQLDYALVDTVKRGETYLDTTFESAHQASDQWMRDYERPKDEVGGSKKHRIWLDTYGSGLGAI